MADLPPFIGMLESIRHLLQHIDKAENVAFNAYWKMHVDLLASNTVVFWLPHDIGHSLNQQGILSIVCRDIVYVPSAVLLISGASTDFRSNTTRRNAYIVFDNLRNAFRIGDGLIDDLQYQPLILEVISIGELVHRVPLVVANQAAIIPPVEMIEDRPLELALGDADLLHLNDNEPAPVARRRPISKVPKPRNSWIIYRSEKHHRVVADHPNIPTAMICE